MVAAFPFVALNGNGGVSRGRKIVSDKNKALLVLTHEFESFSLPCIANCAYFHFSPARPPRGRGGADVSISTACTS